MSEQTEATEPKVDEGKVLAERATAYLDKDRVTRAQALVYQELLTSGPTGDPLEDFLPGATIEEAMSWANKSVATPKEVKDRLRDAYSHLKPSHQWLKAVIATAIALKTEDEA